PGPLTGSGLKACTSCMPTWAWAWTMPGTPRRCGPQTKAEASYDRPPGPVQDPRRRPGPRRAGRDGADAAVDPGRPGPHQLRRALRPAGLPGADPARGGG